ncbi:MAG: ATP-binding cassette domain-containing protein [Defluviitaleaceae bacterium]|nr:ATP-binding cassette domain-containing protein [Defluviitaleaceae bacterium]
MSESLKIKSLTKKYKKSKYFANDDISFEILPNKITSIVGHNGAGKTTLLNQIVGSIIPDSGDIIFKGKSLSKNPNFARKNVSMMPQFHAPLDGVTLKQSIESIMYIKGMPKKDIKAEALKIIKELEIEEWQNKSGDKLSGGVGRLTSFAMATAFAPKIILLDEPTNDVDPIRRKLIWKYLRTLANNGHIILIVTHNLLEVEQYSDRFILLNKGKLVKDSLTGIVENKIKYNTLIVEFINETNVDEIKLPEHKKKNYSKEQRQLTLEINTTNLKDCMQWITENIEKQTISNYKLSPISLENSYGGYIDESE